MSQYSEVIGSFLRRGKFPLEADYVFTTEEALIEYYSQEENKAILHKGLLKVVEDDGSGLQALYWVTESTGTLTFTKLLTASSIEELTDKLQELSEQLEQEIAERKAADEAIYGTSDVSIIPEDLNNISKLADAVLLLQEELKTLSEYTDNIKEELKATVGTTSDDIISYLNTLDYKSLTELSERLNTFFNSVDSDDTSINTWVELSNFLQGIADSETLSGLLQANLDTIYGDPFPTTQFATLRGIEDFVRQLRTDYENSYLNLKKEIDDTQAGIGLDASGYYSPDPSTNYLTEATSIVHALRILDDKIAECINTLVMRIVKEAYYDSATESLVIVVTLSDESEQVVTIPVASLIREWEVNNDGESDVVELTKVEDYGAGADQLSADVRLSTSENNILVKDGNTLYVRGTSDNITHNDTTVGVLLDDLFTQVESLENSITSTINTIQEHIDNKTNPHEVTAEQVNAYTKEEIENLLSQVYSKEEVDSLIASLDFYTKEEVESLLASIYTKEEVENLLANIYNKEEVDNLLANLDFYTRDEIETLLTNIYTKEEIETLLSNIYSKEEIETLLSSIYTKEEITTLLESIYTKEEIESLLSNIYNKDEVEDLLSNVYTKEEVETLLSNLDVYTKEEVETLLSNVYSKEELTTLLEGIYTKDEVENLLSNIYTKEEVETLLANLNVYTKEEIESLLSNVYTKDEISSLLSDIYSKTEVDSLLANLNVYTKEEVEALISGLNFYTKEEIDSIISGLDSYSKAEVDELLSNLDFYTKAEVDSLLSDLNVYNKTEVDALITNLQNDIENIRTELQDEISSMFTREEIQELFNNVYTREEINNLLETIQEGVSALDVYTKTEVDNLLSQKADLVDGKVPISQLPEIWAEI